MDIEKAIQILYAAWKESVRDSAFQNSQKLDWEEALYSGITAMQEKRKQEAAKDD